MNAEKNTEAADSQFDLPDQVFHYTAIDTLMKIVASRSLWCTALPYLNDPEERRFLVEAVRSRLSILKSTEESIHLDLALGAVLSQNASDVTSFANEAFVACFAEHGDSLVHWRAYCPQQAGVAIGFRSSCLRYARFMEKPQPGVLSPQIHFRRVEYLDIRNSKALDDVIRLAQMVAKMEVAKDDAWTLNDYFSGIIDLTACMSKQQAFEVEDELRLLLPHVHYRENNIHFRTVRSTLIPYVQMIIPSWNGSFPVYDFERERAWNAIESVVVGPTANMPLTQRSLQAYFALQGMDVRVLPSRVPYRDW